MNEIMKQLNLKSMTLIEKGWSCDKKYSVVTNDDKKYLLRITPFDKSGSRKALFDILGEVSKLHIPMCKPVDFGECNQGVYTLHTWIDGVDAEEIIPLLSETQQYVLGVQAGEILKKIHTIPAPENQEQWYTKFKRKTEYKITKYLECPIQFEGGDKVIDYINKNFDLLKNRPQCFQHGDYHIGNMMMKEDELYIIDFDRFDFGDPWEEFNRIVWCAQSAPYFATGMVDGYFNKNVSMEFWKLLALYIGSNTLSSIYWAISFGQSDLDVMLNQAKDVLNWYDNMEKVVPKWYIKDFYIQYTDGVPYKLKSYFDFSFLSKYGKVFKVFDDQDSGNICFGVEKENKKYFVKFAGAPTERSEISADEAVVNLKNTVHIYKDLAHESLIKYICDEEIGDGYAVVFEWVNAECMGRMYPLSRKKFMSMDIKEKIKVFEDVLIFHKHIANNNYVAIDFYDGSVMYDFENFKTILCDIDFYAKTPYINQIGRMWGSSKMMSPEEFTKGNIIDEITNVYTIGAFAFALFSDYDRTKEKWNLPDKLYDVIIKAVSNDRNKRQQSIEELINNWNDAKLLM